MKNILFAATFILFFFSFNIYADDISAYKDKDGVINITDGPVPEKYEKKAKKVDAYNRDEVEKYHKQQESINNYKRNFQEPTYEPQRVERVAPRTVYVGGSSSSGMTQTEKNDCKRDCDMELNTCQSSCGRRDYSYTKRDNRDVARSEGYCKETCQTNYRSCKSGCR